MDRERIEKLQAQVAEISAELESLKAKAEPEWVPFPGEIIETRAYTEAHTWQLRVATGGTDKMGRVTTYLNGERSGEVTTWADARPLSDPNVIQLRPHKAGDPMPCAPDTLVIVRFCNGIIPNVNRPASEWEWVARGSGGYSIAAWAPLPGMPA